MKLFYSMFFTTLSCLVVAQETTPDIIRGSETFKLIIKVEDRDTKKPVEGTEVYLYHTKSGDLLNEQTVENGKATFNIDPHKEYEIRTCNNEYFKGGMSIYECNEGNEILCTFGASHYTFGAGGGPSKPDAMLQATLSLNSMKVGSILELENVYYDLDKASLRPSAKQELQELATIMKRNKSITIELSSHTDSRASKKYNKDLSNRRAQSCYQYLIDLGIAPDRIRPVGYGESRLVNQCADNVDCSEKQHQKNRRTEIEILTYTPIECKPSLDLDFKIKDLKNEKL